MWCFLLTLLASLTFSRGQYQNESSFNCTPVDWNKVNTTNYTELDNIFEQCLNRVTQYEDCPDPALCEDSQSSDENLGLAFGLTAAAGLATTVGSLIPFVPCIRRSDTKYLAVSLGLAAGVMLYVSFTEIFIKSQYQFCCVSVTHHNLLTTACFFIGIFLTVALDMLVKLLEKIDCGCCKCEVTCCSPWRMQNVVLSSNNSSLNRPSCNHMSVVSPLANGGGMIQCEGEQMNTQIDNEGNALGQSNSSNNESPSLHNRAEFVSNELDGDRMANTPNVERASISATSNTVSTTTNNLGDASIQDLLSNTSIHRLHAIIAESVSVMNEDQSHISVSLNEDGMSVRTQPFPPNGDANSRVGEPSIARRNSDEDEEQQGNDVPVVVSGEERSDQFKEVSTVLGSDVKHLRRMGVLTGLALALHNFPEGLATFIATLSDPSLGAALAVAIALHNIPEGICVAMPIYYATGSRLKAFFWAFMSGVSEPIGALLGWAILRTFFGPVVYGVSFGIIAGMMVYISLKELLPTAHKFDKTNGTLVIVFLVVGMAIMALSLVLFYY